MTRKDRQEPSSIESLTKEIVAFREERDWKQFHNAKDLAIAASIEAGELLELFLWKSPVDADREQVRRELADLLMYCLLLAHEEELDVAAIIREKLAENRAKYPVSKARGNAKKYTEL
jgi:NTP pyrophosphatase (non-canonical NTP hydrolase)